MVIRYEADHEGEETDGFESVVRKDDGEFVTYRAYAELEAENARLRQQRDAANAQLDFLIEEMKKAP
ncbi:TPA: hypothetical protein ACXHW4_004217 [Enterobacter hormaechei]